MAVVTPATGKYAQPRQWDKSTNHMAVDLKKLRNAIEVANSGSITLAAQNLFISQSTLTRSIADLESDIGVQLFKRTPKGVIPTDAGREFVSKAKLIANAVDDLVAGAGAHRDLQAGRLRIGFASAMFQRIVMGSIAELVRGFPGLGVELSSGSGEQMVPLLVSGELDALVGRLAHLQRWAELEVTGVLDLHCKLMVRMGHPLLALDDITPHAVLAYPFVQSSAVELSVSDVRNLYSVHRLPPKDPHYLCEDFEQVSVIVENSDAFCVVFSPTGRFHQLAQKFTVLDNVIGVPQQTLAVATRTARPPSPAVQVFVETLCANLLPTPGT